MKYDLEPEIQDGGRGFPVTQELFAGTPEAVLLPSPVYCSWYGTAVDPRRGAFCLVQEESGLGELVGEFLRINHGSASVTCYCLGESAQIATSLAVTRRAWMVLELLPVDQILVSYEAVG